MRSLFNYRSIFPFFLFVLINTLSFGQGETKIQIIATDSTSGMALLGVKIGLTCDLEKSPRKLTDSAGIAELSYTLGKCEIINLNYSFEDQKLKTIQLPYPIPAIFQLRINTSQISLGEVQIIAVKSLMTNKGDTLEADASNFKVNTDATAEDLIKKIPGVTMENGRITAQGEQVARIYVDGQEFFGEDPSMALKNLPAGAVQKVQVYDKQSDQAAFTRFSDGNSQKTINIITKKSFKQSVFGKVFGAGGTENRYNVGGNLNYFNGIRRLSLLGNFNNINIQNFSFQDIMSATGSQMGGGMRRMMGSMSPGMMGNYMSGNNGGGPGDFSSFFSSPNQGVNSVKALGINYSDQYKRGVTFATSYFVNQMKTISKDTTARTYFINDSTFQFYNAGNRSTATNLNHRINFRLGIVPDSNNSITFAPKLTLQQGITEGFSSNNNLQNARQLNFTKSENQTKLKGYVFSTNLIWNHKFFKAGRTLSSSVTFDQNRTNGIMDLMQSADFYKINDTVISGSTQNTKYQSNSGTMAGSFAWTEPLGKYTQLRLNYNPSITTSLNDRRNTILANNNSNSLPLDGLFENAFQVQRGGFAIGQNFKRLNINGGVNIQNSRLTGNSVIPVTSPISRTYINVLPNAFMTFKINKMTNWRANYQTSITAPRVEQLQTVVNNSNPNSLTLGNDRLNQQYDHSFGTRFSFNHPTNGSTFTLALRSALTLDFIGNATKIATNDTNLNGINIKQGMQLTTFENFKNSSSVRGFASYGFKIPKLKCNFNINSAFMASEQPTRINGILGKTNTQTIMGTFMLTSNISEKIDFTIDFSNTYNISKNSLNTNVDNNFLTQGTKSKVTWNPWKGIILSTEINYTRYAGLKNGFNQEILLCNAEIGYKFLKNKAADIRVIAFDLLNKNQNIVRNIQPDYVEDQRTLVLNRYFLLQFTYTFTQPINRKPEPAKEGDKKDTPTERK